MTREKQPVDVEVLDRIRKIKNLERELADGDVPSLDLDSLEVLRERGFNDEEIEDFRGIYSKFARDYLSTIIPNIASREFQELYNENREVLKGTPEGEYLRRLIGDSQVDKNYDIRLDELELSVRTANCLRRDGINYVGQLVQIQEADMLRGPNFGRKSLRELKEILNQYGLKFGMDINYLTPEERGKGKE